MNNVFDVDNLKDYVAPEMAFFFFGGGVPAGKLSSLSDFPGGSSAPVLLDFNLPAISSMSPQTKSLVSPVSAQI